MSKLVNNPPILPIPGKSGTVQALNLYDTELVKALFNEVREHAMRLNNALMKDGSEPMTGPLPFVPLATADIPAAADWEGAFVWDTTLNVFKYSDGTVWLTIPSTSLYREKLTGARTYYVRTDGNDSNTGLVNSAGGAFLTIQAAVNAAMYTIDTAGANVTIQLGDGTYTIGTSIPGRLHGLGTLTIQGNATTPGNVIINPTNNHCILALQGSQVHVKDLELRTTTTGFGLAAIRGAFISFSNIRFGAIANAGIYIDTNAIVQATGNYSIVGNAERFLFVDGGQAWLDTVTVTLTGTPAFSQQFVLARLNALALFRGVTFSGAATGQRFYVDSGAVVHTNSGGATFLPGNAAGAGTNFGAAPYGLYV